MSAEILTKRTDINVPKRPESGFVAVAVDGDVWRVAALNGTKHEFTLPGNDPLATTLPSLYGRLNAIDLGTHWRTVGIAGLNGGGRDVAAKTWWERGMSTILFEDSSGKETPALSTDDVLARVQEKHTLLGQRKIEIGPDGRVYSSRLGKWTDYEPFYSESAWKENTGVLDNIAKENPGSGYVGVEYWDDNTTAFAGGVAGMNHPKQRYVEDRNETEREKIARGEEGHLLEYKWMKKDDRIDSAIAAKHGINLQDPELLRLYGEPDPDNPGKLKLNIYILTKKRHVMLQNDCEPEDVYTEKDDALYHAWSETQYQLNLKPALIKAKEEGKKIALKLEDQQTWGQLEYLRQDFPQDDPESDFLTVIARNHIHSRAVLAADPTSKQYPLAQSILRDLSHGIDLFMVHRSNDEAGRDEFLFRDPNDPTKIHPIIADKVVYAEASYDEMDGLGRRVTAEERPLLDAENNYNLYTYGQTPDDFSIPGVGIYARDDESKDKLTGMLGYARFAKMMLQAGVPLDKIPNYRDIAMGAADDPSGKRIHWSYLVGLHPELAEKVPEDVNFKKSDRKVIGKLQAAVAEDPWLANKIKKYRFTYDEYDDRNRRAIEDTVEFGLQTSSSEACEDEISRKIANGTYTAVANVGGMPPQVEKRVSGAIIDKSDGTPEGDEREVNAYANEMFWYFTQIYPNSEVRSAFRQRVKAALKPQYTTLYNIAREFGAGALTLYHKDQIPAMIQQHHDRTGQYPFVPDLVVPLYGPKEEIEKQAVKTAPIPVEKPSLNFVARETQVFPA